MQDIIIYVIFPILCNILWNIYVIFPKKNCKKYRLKINNKKNKKDRKNEK